MSLVGGNARPNSTSFKALNAKQALELLQACSRLEDQHQTRNQALNSLLKSPRRQSRGSLNGPWGASKLAKVSKIAIDTNTNTF